MQESTVAGELVMRWVPVVDLDGRTHMEAHWQVATDEVPTSIVHAA